MHHPEHANRLWLVMSLAYAWALSLGTQAAHGLKARRRVTRGTESRHSLFALGLRIFHSLETAFNHLLYRFDLLFLPLSKPDEKTVVQ